MLRQAYYVKPGNLAQLRIREEALPELGPDEVRVAVKAIGLNFADVFAIWGLYKAAPKEDFIPGLEYAGVITETGSAVTAWKSGDQVMGVTRFGGYATHIQTDRRYLVRVPGPWSLAQGAAYPVQALTAYYALFPLGNLQKGQSVLIHSAAGGVGIWAGRMARQTDAFTIGTVGSEHKVPFLKEEGWDAWIVRDARRFGDQIDEALDGRELNLTLDSIGGKFFHPSFQRLAPQGRQVVYGSARYASPGNRPNLLRMLWLWLNRPKVDPQQLPQTNRSVMGFNLIYLYERVELMHEYLQTMSGMELGQPHIGHAFSFERLPEAIRLFQGGQTIGKVVVEVKD